MSSHLPPRGSRKPERQGQQPQPQPSKPGEEPPLWAPWFGIGLLAAVKRPFSKYTDFSGRASRGEYWWFFLAYSLVVVVLYAIFGILGIIFGVINANSLGNQAMTENVMAPPGFTAVKVIFQIIFIVLSLGLLLPYLALTWRRLHDANYPGPYFFLGLIPLIGPLLLIVYLAGASKPEGARFDRPR